MPFEREDNDLLRWLDGELLEDAVDGRKIGRPALPVQVRERPAPVCRRCEQEFEQLGKVRPGYVQRQSGMDNIEVQRCRGCGEVRLRSAWRGSVDRQAEEEVQVLAKLLTAFGWEFA